MGLNQIRLLFLLLLPTESYEAILWKISDDSVNAVEGQTASLKWGVEFTESSESWFSAGISRKSKTASEQEQYSEMIKKVNLAGSVSETITLTSRAADMSLKITSMSNMMNVTFVLRNLNSATDGMRYQISLGSTKGSLGSKVTMINILDKPKYTELNVVSDNSSFCVGKLVRLLCTSQAMPPADYSLYYNDQLVEKRRANGSFDVHVMLNITGINTYTCITNNTVGIRQNKSVHLLVKEPPKISSCYVISASEINNAVIEGERVSLMCNISGSGPFHTTWTKGNKVWTNSSLIFERINHTNAGIYHVMVNDGTDCDKPVEMNLTVIVFSFENPKVIGSSNKGYSPSHPEVWFNVSVTSYPNDISLSCETSTSGIFTILSIYNTGLNVKTYIVFVIIKTVVDSARIECVAKRGAIVRRTTLFVYKQPTTTIFKEKITGRFEITNHLWQDDLNNSDSAAYRNLKSKCMKILEKAYDNIPYVVGKDITKFVKGSVIVEFQLEIIKQISDPLLPLKTLTNKSRGEIDGIRIDIKSIIESKDVTHDCKIEDKQPGNKTNNAVVPVLGALLALSVLIIILLIIVEYFRLYRNGSNKKLPIRYNHNAEHSHVNEIPLQESSFKITGNVSPNEAEEHEPIGRRGLQASNAAIPEYEAVATKQRQAYYLSNKTDDQDNQIQTRNQEGQLPTNTPPIYQETREQPHTYGSLSPFTKLPPKNTLSSSPNQTGEYQSLQQRGVAPHYQSLDDLSKC